MRTSLARQRVARLTPAALGFCLTAASAPAQSAPSSPPSARGPVVRGRDLGVLAATALATAALMPFDRRIARWSQRPGAQQSRAADVSASVFNALGDPGAITLAGGTYVVGLVAGRRLTAAVGLETAEAIVAAGAVTAIGKVLIGRARPYVVADSNPTDYRFGRGLRRGNAYQSLPSGHATAAFALAGALATQGAHRWPHLNRVTGPAGFAAATLVGAARVYRDRHWASDVALGAGIGTVTGAAVVRYALTHAEGGLNRRLLPSMNASAAPLVSWTVRF